MKDEKRFEQYKNLVFAEMIERESDLSFSHVKSIIEDTTLEIFAEVVGDSFYSYPPAYWAEKVKYI